MSSAGESALVCPSCGAENSPFNPRCARCDHPLSAELVATTDLFPSAPSTDTHDLDTSLAPIDPFAATVPADARDAPLAKPHALRDGKLGRFEVIRILGKGAMGLVLLARDPTLGRDVAIKVLKPRSSVERAKSRLVREARAMAKIKHPNVVTVYEVDTSSGDALVVMEYVEGRTLRAYVNDDHPSIDAIVDAYLQAGRGLAEVHREGLVHRDFKPDNVLVGADGRVRVTDFGLVGLTQEYAESAQRDELSTNTRSQGIAGTPAYMAPEQHERRDLDARADQFAFAVSLWEALAGKRPFGGDTYEALRDNVLHGRTNELPRTVPKHLRRALTRALSIDREARYPTMDALLADLAPRPRASQRRLLAIGAASLLALAALGISLRSKREPCRGGEQKLQGVWDNVVKANVLARFKGTGRPYAEDTFQRVERALDERARAWTAMYTDSCEATHVRGEQSAALLDLRTACLDRRRAELHALTALLAEAQDPEVLDHAVSAARSLYPVDLCANADALRAAVPPPGDPALRAKIDALRGRIGEGRAQIAAGKLNEAIPIAASVAEEAKKIGYTPLEAEAMALLGKAERERDLERSEGALREASLLAAKAKDDRLLAEVLIELMYVIGVRRERRSEALGTETAALSAVERAGGDPVIRADLLATVANIHRLDADAARALPKIQEAITLYERALGPGAPELAAALETLGNVYNDMDRHEESRAPMLRALDVRRRAFGGDHPLVAQSLINLATSVYGRGKIDEAIGLNREALGILERALGKDHLRVGVVLGNLAVMLADKARYDEALDLNRRSLAIREAKLGGDHPDVALIYNNMAVIHDERGQYEDAARDYERALAARERHYGPDHAAVASTLASLADSLGRQGRYDEAKAKFDRAIAIYEKRGKGTSEKMASALSWLGDMHLRMNKPHDALAPLTRALAIREGNAAERDPFHLAETRFALGRALWATGGDRRRAVALVREARDAFVKAGDDGKKPLVDVNRWLTERAVR